jgi:hypothetical protein
MLNPNCSETVFRLEGSFKEIKKQVSNLIKWTEMEYDGSVGDGPREKLTSEMVKQFNEVKKQLKDAKTLEEIEQIVITFTCNYETFFKQSGEDVLLVATCNNYTYDNVSKFDSNDDYWDVAGKTTYDVKEIYDGSYILKLRYDDDVPRKFPLYIITEPNTLLTDSYWDGPRKIAIVGSSVDVVSRNKAVFIIKNNKLQPIEELRDKVKLNKIKLVLNLEKC